jgi:fimbrial chaperone protein
VGQAGVGFSVRYSIPVFFSKPGADADLSWQAVVVKGQFILKAENSGGRRARLASLVLVNGAGKTIHVGEGLAGYVLGQSAKQWTVKGASKTIAAGGTVKITAQGENGPIEATAKVVAAN